MWGNHFFKHLPFNSFLRFSPRQRRLIRGISPSPLCPFSAPHPWRFTSMLLKFSTSSSSTNPFTSPYFSVRIRCPKDNADLLAEVLLCFGASSTTMDEQGGDDSTDEVCIDSIFPDGEDVDVCISHAADSIGLKELPSYEVRVGEQYDWIKKTQESFHPVEITKGLWVVPKWRTPPDVHATNIILNPGFAFGTGEHPTTRLCLLMLRALIKGGEFFLDYGTGSGILAIAALKFGAATSVGIDVDPLAITAATQNAALNDINPDKMQLRLVTDKTKPRPKDGRTNEVVQRQRSSALGVMPETERFDVVIANILLNPLLHLADDIVSYAKPGAVVAVSGIISEQLPYIMERYSPLLENMSVTEMDDWACVGGTKKSNLTIS